MDTDIKMISMPVREYERWRQGIVAARELADAVACVLKNTSALTDLVLRGPLLKFREVDGAL